MSESDHTYIFWAIVAVGLLVAISNYIGALIICRSLKKMMSYHGEFAAIHVQMHNDINHVIKRQGQIAGILRAGIIEARTHDKMVKKVMKEIGVELDEPEQQQKNPGP